MIERAVQKVGFATGHVVHKERAMVVAEAMHEVGWTEAELDEARRLILTDGTLLKEIGYNRTVGTSVFAQARERHEVMRGRLFGYQEAMRYAETRQVPLGELFTVVRMQDEVGEHDVLKAYWRLTK